MKILIIKFTVRSLKLLIIIHILSVKENENYVSYKGFKKDLSYWFNRARLFVLPSLWDEGCPTAILEAFSFAIPVVAHNIDGIPELINHDVDGFLVSPNSNQLSQYIIKLLRDPFKASLMGLSGRNKVRKYYRLNKCVDRHFDVFSNLIN